jgi:uncharacterized Zn-finger protein
VSVILYFIYTQVASFLTNGKTIGMVLINVYPANTNNNSIKYLKLFIYNTAQTVIIAAFFAPFSSIMSNILFPLVMIVPWKIEKRYSSLIDLLFKFHWSNDEMKMYNRSKLE